MYLPIDSWNAENANGDPVEDGIYSFTVMAMNTDGDIVNSTSYTTGTVTGIEGIGAPKKLEILPGNIGYLDLRMFADASIARLLPKVAEDHDTPLVAVVDSGHRFDAMVGVLEDGGLPVFRSADRAVRVLRKWVDVKLRRSES